METFRHSALDLRKGLGTRFLRGMPRLKTGLVSNFLFFVGSHKCAYPTDIELTSDRVNIPLYPSVYPNFPAPIRNHILSLRFAIMCAR